MGSLLPPRLRRSKPKNPSLRLRLKSSPHKLKLLLPRLAKRPARSTSPGKNGERRGGYTRGPKTDEDGFAQASDRPAQRGNYRGGERRGGRGGYSNSRGGAEGGEGGNFRRGGNRGGGRGRGATEGEPRPNTSEN